MFTGARVRPAHGKNKKKRKKKGRLRCGRTSTYVELGAPGKWLWTRKAIGHQFPRAPDSHPFEQTGLALIEKESLSMLLISLIQTTVSHWLKATQNPDVLYLKIHLVKSNLKKSSGNKLDDRIIWKPCTIIYRGTVHNFQLQNIDGLWDFRFSYCLKNLRMVEIRTELVADGPRAGVEFGEPPRNKLTSTGPEYSLRSRMGIHGCVCMYCGLPHFILAERSLAHWYKKRAAQQRLNHFKFWGQDNSLVWAA